MAARYTRHLHFVKKKIYTIGDTRGLVYKKMDAHFTGYILVATPARPGAWIARKPRGPPDLFYRVRLPPPWARLDGPGPAAAAGRSACVCVDCITRKGSGPAIAAHKPANCHNLGQPGQPGKPPLISPRRNPTKTIRQPFIPLFQSISPPTYQLVGLQAAS